jgi:hypothetical protein
MIEYQMYQTQRMTKRNFYDFHYCSNVANPTGFKIVKYAKITYANIQLAVTTKQTKNSSAPNVYNKTNK